MRGSLDVRSPVIFFVHAMVMAVPSRLALARKISSLVAWRVGYELFLVDIVLLQVIQNKARDSC